MGTAAAPPKRYVWDEFDDGEEARMTIALSPRGTSTTGSGKQSGGTGAAISSGGAK